MLGFMYRVFHKKGHPNFLGLYLKIKILKTFFLQFQTFPINNSSGSLNFKPKVIKPIQ